MNNTPTPPNAQGLPPAPLQKLTLDETKSRTKVIIGAQSGENPAHITDDSPVLRANILPQRLLGALNNHFFPAPLNGIIGFPAGETVIQLARRIKHIRDPQVP